MYLIGIAGYAQVGKDTAATALTEMVGFQRKAHADSLKRLTAIAVPDYAVDMAELGAEAAKKKHRESLVRLGAGCRKVFGPDIFINCLEEEYEDWGRYVVPDVRYENEANAIKFWDGFDMAPPQFEYKSAVILVERPGFGPANSEERESVPKIKADATVVNDGSITDLRSKILDVVLELGFNLYPQSSSS